MWLVVVDAIQVELGYRVVYVATALLEARLINGWLLLVVLVAGAVCFILQKKKRMTQNASGIVVSVVSVICLALFASNALPRFMEWCWTFHNENFITKVVTLGQVDTLFLPTKERSLAFVVAAFNTNTFVFFGIFCGASKSLTVVEWYLHLVFTYCAFNHGLLTGVVLRLILHVFIAFSQLTYSNYTGVPQPRKDRAVVDLARGFFFQRELQDVSTDEEAGEGECTPAHPHSHSHAHPHSHSHAHAQPRPTAAVQPRPTVVVLPPTSTDVVTNGAQNLALSRSESSGRDLSVT